MPKTKEIPGPAALAVIPKSQYAGLSKNPAEMRAALDALAEAGESLGPGDLIRVPIPAGGSTTWQIPTLTGDEESAKEITGVLVYYQKCGVLWPSEEFSEGSQPVLRTLDLKTAEQVGPIPKDMEAELAKCKIGERLYNWESLSYNQFGSSKKSPNGKRCKEQRMLFILRPGDVFPILITAQPGSLNQVTSFIKRLPMLGIQYWGAIVTLGLQKETNEGGQPYSQIVMRLAGKLSQEDAAVVRSTWTEPLSAMIRDIPINPPPSNREPGEED